MRTIHLMNSAMMPQPGQYQMRSISQEEFVAILQSADAGEGGVVLKSSIGYPQNIPLIKKWSGVGVQLNRSQTTLQDGDAMLVMKLKYRVADPTTKGSAVPQDEFEFCFCEYRSN